MKIGIVGSRNVTVENIEKYVSQNDEIVSGGAVGVDRCAAEYAIKNNLKLTEFLPDYEHYGRGAPIVRNKLIVDYSDKIYIFWNGTSKGAKSVIEYAKKTGKDHEVIFCEPSSV